MKILIDTYSLHSRVLPAIIAAMPFFILLYFLTGISAFADMFAYLGTLKFYGGLSLSIVFLYAFAMLARITSKAFESAYFKRKSGFPTTYLMLYENQQYSDSYKQKYRDKVKHHFDLDLIGKQEEAGNRSEAIKRLEEAVKHVILHVGNGQLVLKHNMWYGFYRNLAGGSIYGTLLCIISAVLGVYILRNATLVSLSSVLLVIYVPVLLLNKWMIVRSGEDYAKQLIAEFLQS